MTTCRWSPDAGDYLTPDGDPCRRDDYGDPTHHCTARRTCSLHIGANELTCARCLGRARQDLRQIVERASLMPEEAKHTGINSEAASLAGPAADYETFVARRAIDKAWVLAHITQPARDWCDDPDCPQRHFKNDKGNRWHKRGFENAWADLIADDDEVHPRGLLERWQWMLSEDYGHERVGGIGEAAAYLDRHLHRIAQDPEQDFALLARELRACRSHLEAVLRDSRAPERGAPCPTCKDDGHLVRLQLEYPHWCDDEDCHQIHVTTDELDVWRCPRNKDHWWNPAGYANLIEERLGA